MFGCYFSSFVLLSSDLPPHFSLVIWVSLTGCRFFSRISKSRAGNCCMSVIFHHFCNFPVTSSPHFSLVIWVFVPLGARDPPVRRRHTDWRFFVGPGRLGAPPGARDPPGNPRDPSGTTQGPQGPQGPLESKKLLGAAPPGSVWCWSVFWCSVWCWSFFLVHCGARRQKMFRWSVWCWSVFWCMAVPGVEKCFVGQIGVGHLLGAHRGAKQTSTN